MRESDRRAIDDAGIPAIVLMENAARSCAEEIERRWRPLSDLRVIVVCGSGNNGGDGFAIARHLYCRYSASPVIVCVAPTTPGASAGDARTANLESVRRLGIPCHEGGLSALQEVLVTGADLLVDCLLGTGSSSAPRADMASIIRLMNSSALPIIAVDIPSGIDVDTGQAYDPAVRAAVTVTLGYDKVGLHLRPASEHAGDIVVGEIGLPPPEEQSLPTTVLIDSAEAAPSLPVRTAGRDVNKGTFGSVALFCGSPGFLGAATLASHGASRAGAGITTLCVPDRILDPAMSRLPDVVMAKAFPSGSTGSFSSAGVSAAIEFCGKSAAVAIGPGIGVDDDDTGLFVRGFIGTCPVPVVVDADALTWMSRMNDRGADLCTARASAGGRRLLTPHPGEMGRLLGTSSAEVQADRIGSVRRAAEKYQSIVLLKGDSTIIASPDGRVAINTTGNPGMASGGMGDLLTGICAAFLAARHEVDPFHAAMAAAYIHGRAGDQAAESIPGGPLIADDLFGQIAVAMSRTKRETDV